MHLSVTPKISVTPENSDCWATLHFLLGTLGQDFVATSHLFRGVAIRAMHTTPAAFVFLCVSLFIHSHFHFLAIPEVKWGGGGAWVIYLPTTHHKFSSIHSGFSNSSILPLHFCLTWGILVTGF